MPTSRSAAEKEALTQLLAEAERLLDAGDLVRCEATVQEAASIDPEAAGVAWLRGELAWQREDLDTARRWLTAAAAADPAHADARWSLARLLELRGDRAQMIAHDLAVRRLDARADRLRGIGEPGDVDHVEAVATAVLAALPLGIAARLHNVPVVLEARPPKEIVAEGFDPRALGLFEGADDFAQRSGEQHSTPTRIVLFYANLLATCPDDETLAEQIEVTVLHEVGHFFGLDEDEVDALGLA
jgi:predicted Zn-dependent protease with MMP-like domain